MRPLNMGCTMPDIRSWSIFSPIGALALCVACTTESATATDGPRSCDGAACATGGANSGGSLGSGGIGAAGVGGGAGLGGSSTAGAGGSAGATATGGASGMSGGGRGESGASSGGSGGVTGNGGTAGDGGSSPPIYTLVVDAPSNNSTVRGLVTVSGRAPGFLNVEVQDGAHMSPPLARVTPAVENGAFRMTVDTTTLASGSTSWTVLAWDSAPGQPFNHTANVALSLTIDNSPVTDTGPPPKGKVVVGINPQAFASWGATKKQNLVDSSAHSIRVPARHGSASLIDDTVATAQANGMSVLYFAGYNPPSGDVRTSSTARQLYADIALQDAQKYGNVIAYIEVWNEWNGGFDLGCSWGQAGTACTDHALYTDLLCKVYDTVKPARPDIKIIGGATAGVDIGFITGMLNAGAANCMDMISVHPYVFTTTAYSVPPDATATAGVDKFLEAITDVHDLVLQRSGKDMPVVISEDGRSDGGNAANYQRVADYVRELYARAPTVPFLEGIWWYELEDEPAYQNGWGLTQANGAKKPSFAEIRSAAIALAP
jgi:hypothetical protein